MADTSVEAIDVSSPYFGKVVDLGDRLSNTVGFYPRQAFKESARKGQILAAIDPHQKQLLGYILFRVARARAVLQHLCVDPDCRGRKVAKLLVDALKDRTRHLSGIELHCAREYGLSGMWSSLGFLAVGEKIGRGKDRRWLTRWWFDHAQPDLFTSHRAPTNVGAILAAIDANVFFAMCSDDYAERDTRALEADWLDDTAELAIASEILNEIDRNQDAAERDSRRNFARTLHILPSQTGCFDETERALKAMLPAPRRLSDESDIRHLAGAISGQATVFITWDERLLRERKKVSQTFGLKLLTPAEFVTYLDELLRESEYAPARLAGSEISFQRLTSDSLRGVIGEFLATGRGEKKHELSTILDGALADPKRVDAIEVTIAGGKRLAISVTVRESEATNCIALLRVAPHPLAGTVARHLIARAASPRPDTAYVLSRMTDVHAPDCVSNAMPELGFVRQGDHWVKLSLKLCDTRKNLLARLRVIREGHSDCAFLDALSEDIGRLEMDGKATEKHAQIERSLFPACILDSPLESFVIPIQPRWASQLFDERLAREDLIPADPGLALRCENVYYKAAKPAKLMAPGRILWYVSKGYQQQAPGPQSIRAWSILDEVVVDVPKALFRRFERLGVYRWHHVLEQAGGQHDRKIMACRFGATDQFRKPTKRADLQDVINRHHGGNQPLRTAVNISPDCFKELYDLGYDTSNL